MTAYSKTLTLTRTADTNGYTAGDVIGVSTSAGGGVLTFDGFGPANVQWLLFTSTRLQVLLAAVTSGMTSFRLHMYRETPPSAIADNAAWDLTSADRTLYMGYLDLGTPVDVGSTLYVEANGINKQAAITQGQFFGYLVTNGAYTPGSADVMTINLDAVKL